MIFFKPVKTVGVFLTIFEFEGLPAEPAAAARTALRESSSDSELNPVDARALIVEASVAVFRALSVPETVLASAANAFAAAWTLDADTLDFAPDVEPFVVLVLPVGAVAAVVLPEAAFAPSSPLFEADVVLPAKALASDDWPEAALAVVELEDC